MAKFEIKDEEVTLTFNVRELKFADGTTTNDHLLCGLDGFAGTIVHMLEKRPSNWCLESESDSILKQMGLHKYKVTSSNWHSFNLYALSKEDAIRRCSHLKGVRVTEDKTF